MKPITLRMTSVSRESNSTLTACIHDRTSFQFFTLGAVSYNNTYATCGFQPIKTASDGSKRTRHNYVRLCTAVLRIMSVMEKATLISMTLAIMSSSHCHTSVALDI